MRTRGMWVGPLVLTGMWTLGILILLAETTKDGGRGALFVSGVVGFLLGLGGLVQLVWEFFGQWKKAGRSKVTLWSAGRPGEMVVGVVNTGEADSYPGGLVLNLDCLEKIRGGEWLLWTAESLCPSPSSEGAWPFHFSIPMEAPPSGLSPDGEVMWRLRAHSVAPGVFQGEWPMAVSAHSGPASKFLPVPFPKGPAAAIDPHRKLITTQVGDQTRFSLSSPVVFPGPNPLVIWAVALTAFFMVTIRMKAPHWVVVAGGLLNAGAALFLVAQWFGREEVWVDPQFVTIRRSLGPWGSGRKFSRSTLAGVRVVFSGGPQRYGVRFDRAGGARPLYAFGGFPNHLVAHDVARTLLRSLSQIDSNQQFPNPKPPS